MTATLISPTAPSLDGTVARPVDAATEPTRPLPAHDAAVDATADPAANTRSTLAQVVQSAADRQRLQAGQAAVTARALQARNAHD